MNYLQPEDDGLPMRPAGPWAAEKLDYLARYIDVFETAMRQMWPVRNYVDLMAGPGKNRVRDTGAILLGSPILALATTHPFTGYFFADLAEENTRALQQRCAASSLSPQVTVLTGDCNVVVNEVVTRIKPDDRRALNLAFLDSEGLELHWETVRRLASLRRMDLIINYPQGGLNRYLPRAYKTHEQTAVDLFLGGAEWRTIYADGRDKPGLHGRLMDLYKQKLHTLGYREVLRDDEVGDEPLMRNAATNAPLYRLLFASKHPLGHDFWQKITRRDIHGQIRLFR